ncbi:MAG TPA: hypothetical protein VJH55_02800 [Candidatus Paceibacterota bacterium]
MKKKAKTPTLKELAHEVSVLRSFVFGMANIEVDKEGEYKPEFIKELLHDAQTATPVSEFKNAKEFLSRIHRTK